MPYSLLLFLLLLGPAAAAPGGKKGAPPGWTTREAAKAKADEMGALLQDEVSTGPAVLDSGYSGRAWGCRPADADIKPSRGWMGAVLWTTRCPLV